MRHQPTLFEQFVQRFPWDRFDRLARRHCLDRYDDFTARKHFLALLGGSLSGQHGLRATTTALAPNNGALRRSAARRPRAPPSRRPTATDRQSSSSICCMN